MIALKTVTWQKWK